MKVYLLMTDSAYEYDDEQHISVYAKYEDAKKAFDECVEEEMRNDHLVGRSDTVIVTRNDYFSMYTDGWYSADHYTVRINEREVL